MEIVLPVAPGSSPNVPAFLAKLWKLVDDHTTNEMISWSPDGTSFLIHHQATFTAELLPYYYKHSNMASFVRQLNMYGFKKVLGVDSGGLKSEHQDEMEFRHPYFRRGHEFLLEKIKRNVSKPKAVQFAPSMKSEKINEVVNEVNCLKDKQVDLDGKLDTMRLENEALWKEVAILRNKHASQQKIVNKLIQFLVTMVQPGAAARHMSHTGAVSPAVAASIKRKFSSPLAIEDDSGACGSKEPRLSMFPDHITVQDVTNEMLHSPSSSSSSTSLPTVQMASSPAPAATATIAVTPVVSRASSSVSPSMQAVDPVLVNPAIYSGLESSYSSELPSTSSSTKVVRPTLQRQLTREDVDVDVNSMHKELENLKDFMSGQITLDSSLISSLFNPEDPLPNNFDGPVTIDMPAGLDVAPAAGSSTSASPSGSGHPKLRLEMAADMEPPTLFELAEIDDDGGVAESASEVGVSVSRGAGASGGKVSVTPATATLNTPLVFADQNEPLFSRK